MSFFELLSHKVKVLLYFIARMNSQAHCQYFYQMLSLAASWQFEFAISWKERLKSFALRSHFLQTVDICKCKRVEQFWMLRWRNTYAPVFTQSCLSKGKIALEIVSKNCRKKTALFYHVARSAIAVNISANEPDLNKIFFILAAKSEAKISCQNT